MLRKMLTVRMYYVACSRAREDLYIHIQDGIKENDIKDAIDRFTEETERVIDYEFIE